MYYVCVCRRHMHIHMLFFLLQEGFEAIFKTNTEQRIKLLDGDLLLYMVSNLYITNLSTDKI